MIKQEKFNWKSNGTTSVETTVTRGLGESDKELRARILNKYKSLKFRQSPYPDDLFTEQELREMNGLPAPLTSNRPSPLGEYDNFPAPNFTAIAKTRRRGANDL